MEKSKYGFDFFLFCIRNNWFETKLLIINFINKDNDCWNATFIYSNSSNNRQMFSLPLKHNKYVYDW